MMNKENAYSNINFCRYLMKKLMDIKSSVYKRSIDSDNVILDDNKSDKIGVRTLRDCYRAEAIINNVSELCFLSHANDKDHDLYNTISLILEFKALNEAGNEDDELIMSYARIKAFMDNAYNKWRVPDKYFETSITEIEVDESLACKALEDLLENVSKEAKKAEEEGKEDD